MNNIIIFPTDTVYGMGARIDDVESLKEIFNIKSRELNKRLAVLCYDLKQIEEIAYVTKEARILINKFLPGGLSIILKTKEKYINEMIGETIAVRIPNHPIALEILKECPFATTSVNLSSEPPINDYDLINELYNDRVKKIYPNDQKLQEVSSTVVNLTTELTIIREGIITLKQIKEALSE